MTTRAAVFAGGGVGGIAWLLGMLTQLHEDGVDIIAADVLVGTSAGSAAATQLATGQLDAAAQQQLSDETAEIPVQFDMAQFMAAMTAASAAATDRRDASRRIANVPALNPDVTEARRRGVIAARLPIATWPDRRLLIVAVDKATGDRIVFDRDSDVDLIAAVAASCAVPGIWPPTVIDGREYVDGGVHSSTNADLAAGSERTLILVPGAIDEHLQSLITDELASLDTNLLVAANDESLDAIGPNPLDPARRAAAFEAGRSQAQRVGASIHEFWS